MGGSVSACLVFLIVGAGPMDGPTPAPRPPMPATQSPPVERVAPRPPADETRYTISGLQEMALAHNPTLAQVARRIEALQGERCQVGLYPNPVVGYIGEEMGDGGKAGQQGALLGQEFVTAGKLSLNRRIVDREIEAARSLWTMQQLRVANGVRAAGYDVLAARRMIALDRELVRIGEEGLDAAERMFDAQEVSRVDVLQARVFLNTSRVALTEAETEAEAAWRRLATSIGVPALRPGEIGDSMETLPPAIAYEAALAELLTSSPELARAAADVDRARAELDRACAERTPNVDVGTSVRYNHESTTTVASLDVALPLMIYDRNQGGIFRARAEIAGARREVERVRLALEQQLAETFGDYRKARELVVMYRDEILPDAVETLNLTLTGYKQGEFGYLEVLRAQRTFLETHVSYVEGLQAFWTAQTRIEGLLLDGALDSPFEE